MLLLTAVLLGSACADDNAVTTVGLDSESTTGGTDTPSTVTITTLDTTTEVSTSGVDTTDTASSSGADSTTTTGEDTTGDDTTTGEPAAPGQTVNQLVSAGERSASRNYTLVYTFGQPSQLQSTHDSANYRIQGGLIGANGSPP